MTACWGLQRVSKYREGAQQANDVRVYVAVLRLPEVTSDIVVSFNSPVHINNASASAEAVNQNTLRDYCNEPHTTALFEGFIASLQVLDFGLFG